MGMIQEKMFSEPEQEKISLKEGDKVTYTPTKEKGIVKEINQTYDITRVVFHCNNDWDNYKNYTSQMCDPKDLKLGWDE